MKTLVILIWNLVTALCVSSAWMVFEMQITLSASVTLALLIAVGWALFSMLMSMFWREL